MKKYIFPLIFFAFVLLTSCSAYKEANEQEVTILSVGIDYQNNSYKDKYSDDLNSTINDAKEIGYALKAQYDRLGIQNCLIYMLQEGETSYKSADEYYPSADRILNMIKSLKLSEDDLFVFYYSGHGQEAIGDYEAYLACAKYAEDEYTVLSASSLLDTIENLPCRSVLILDCCYSGAYDVSYANDGSISFTESWSRLMESSEYQKVSVLAASRASEKSYGASIVRVEDGSKEAHGFFTYELLSRLGWDHSCESTYSFKQKNKEYTVYGNSYRVVKGLTTEALYKDVMADWFSEDKNYIQRPVKYGTNVNVYLIPRN